MTDLKRSLFWLLDQYPEMGETALATYDVALEQAESADRLGFESLWLAEHHFRRIGTAPNPAVLLAAIAQRTRTIRLGPATAVLPLRNPIHVAEEYALVDVLSGGRLNMGVGSGSQPSEYTPFGVDFDDRKSMYEEHLAELRARWTAASAGEVAAASLNVAPLQAPTPPIYVATLSEETAYRVGVAGDSLLTLLTPDASDVEGVAANIRAHTRGLDESGATGEAIVMAFAYVGESDADVRETVAPALGRLIENSTGAAPPDPEHLYERMRSNDVGVFGTRDEVHAQLERFAAHGIGHVAFVSRFGGMSRDASAESLRRLALLTPPMPK